MYFLRLIKYLHTLTALFTLIFGLVIIETNNSIGLEYEKMSEATRLLESKEVEIKMLVDKKNLGGEVRRGVSEA